MTESSSADASFLVGSKDGLSAIKKCKEYTGIA